MHKGKPPPPTPEQLPWIPPGNTFNRFAGKKNSKNLKLELGEADDIIEEDEEESRTRSKNDDSKDSGEKRKKKKKKKKRHRDEDKESRKRSKDTSVATGTTSGVGTSLDEDEHNHDRNASKMSSDTGHTNYPPGFVPSPTLNAYGANTPFPNMAPGLSVSPSQGMVSPQHQMMQGMVSPQHQMISPQHQMMPNQGIMMQNQGMGPNQGGSNASWPTSNDYPYAQSPYGLRSMPLAPSRTTQRTGPEAWLVFPKQEVLEETNVDDNNNENNNLGGKRSVRSFTARPINFASSIGSQFKRSYANIHNRETPVEKFNLVENGSDELRREQRLKEREENHEKSIKAAIATLVGAALITIAVLIVAFSLPSNNSDTTPPPNSAAEGSACKSYTSLRDDWRRLRSSRSTLSSQSNCDDGLSAGWYRFEGNAGRFLATSAPENSFCGTSVVGYLDGEHPRVHEREVNRDFCFYFNNNKCEYQIEGRVQTCEDEDNGGTFYIYFFNVPRNVRCNFAFCATTANDDL